VRVQLLDGTQFGLVLVNQSFKFGLKLHQAVCQRRFGLEANHPAIHEQWAHRLPINHPISGDLQSGIYAEDSHARSRLPANRQVGEKRGDGNRDIALAEIN
jgi:hypothetical protein